MGTLVVHDSLFKQHLTGTSHPESPERMGAIERGLARLNEIEFLVPRRATRQELLRVHSREYVRKVRRSAAAGGQLGPDTPLCPASHLVARFAVGSMIELTDAVLAGGGPGFAFLRPPGHHAEPDQGMGFCLFNNVALAAEFALTQVDRVGVVDVDVHHGNGTQKAFWERPEVFYLSFHQYPFYPGTGTRDEQGGAGAKGTTFNQPVPPGGDWSEVEPGWKQGVERLKAFAPDLTLVSAGFDAHRDDPLGGLKLTDTDFLKIFDKLEQVSGAELVVSLEGGYNLTVLERLVPRVVGAMG